MIISIILFLCRIAYREVVVLASFLFLMIVVFCKVLKWGQQIFKLQSLKYVMKIITLLLVCLVLVSCVAVVYYNNIGATRGITQRVLVVRKARKKINSSVATSKRRIMSLRESILSRDAVIAIKWIRYLLYA